jgi:hypothetical protein
MRDHKHNPTTLYTLGVTCAIVILGFNCAAEAFSVEGVTTATHYNGSGLIAICLYDGSSPKAQRLGG